MNKGGHMYAFELSVGQYQLVHDTLAVGLAAMLGTTAFALGALRQVGHRYRPALLALASVGIVHVLQYWNLFNTWDAAYSFAALDGYDPRFVGLEPAGRSLVWLMSAPVLAIALLSASSRVLPRVERALLVLGTMLTWTGALGGRAADAAVASTMSTLAVAASMVLVAMVWRHLGRSAPRRSLFRGACFAVTLGWVVHALTIVAPSLLSSAPSSIALGQMALALADIAAIGVHTLLVHAIALDGAAPHVRTSGNPLRWTDDDDDAPVVLRPGWGRPANQYLPR